MSRGRRKLSVLVLVGALVAPVAFVGPATADPGDATTRAVERTVKRTLRTYVCGDVAVAGQPVGHVDCEGARDGVEELVRAVAHEVREAVCGDVAVAGQPVGHVDCEGARDGVEELERALLRELRHLIA